MIRNIRSRTFALVAAGLASGVFAGALVAQTAPAGKTEITAAGKSWPHEIKDPSSRTMADLLKEILTAATQRFPNAQAPEKAVILQVIGAASDCLAYDGHGDNSAAHNPEYSTPPVPPATEPTIVPAHNVARTKVISAHAAAKAATPNWTQCRDDLTHGH